MIYEKIKDFCKARNAGSCYKNGFGPTPRVNFLMDLIREEGILQELHTWWIDDSNRGFNIVLRGDGNRIVTAHHDIVNPKIDNANDNSASVINAIALKILCPEITVVLLDGEEVGGLGSEHLAKQVTSGEFGEIEWVLNLELTGCGGSTFFIGNYPGNLSDHIRGIFDCPIVSTPFNDSVIFRRHGIDSVVINPLPILTEGTSSVKWGEDYLDYSMLYNCHTNRDTLDTINTDDMKKFVESVLVPIITQ
jgi:Peptidase family M28